MAHSLIGSLEEFSCDQGSGDFNDYCERFEQYCLANQIGEGNDAARARKKAVFFSVVGPKTYKLLKTLMAPDKPSDKSLEDIVAALKRHLSPDPVVIGERFVFYQRKQKPGESVSEYIKELHRLIETCKFEDTTDATMEALRDIFIIGLQDKQTQQRLLRDAGVTLDVALETALNNEQAKCHVDRIT
jgi:RNase H-fold protein (predicted Holliday junction resolvase)